MTLTIPDSATSTMEERVAETFASALAEHKKFDFFDRTKLGSFIEDNLRMIESFEDAGMSSVSMTREMAEEIGAVKVHSGVGSWDEPFKDADNPRLKEIEWLRWADRDRLLRGIDVAFVAAQLRSGITNPVTLANAYDWSNDEIKELIRKYGPNMIYTGYPVETEKLDEVLRRPDMLFPFDKAFIVHDTPRNTVEGAQMFKMPKGALAEGKKLVVVSHAPHLMRILHILGKYPYLPNGEWFYISPVATKPNGHREFALMEMRGTLYYTFLQDAAAVETHPYRMLVDTLPQV